MRLLSYTFRWADLVGRFAAVVVGLAACSNNSGDLELERAQSAGTTSKDAGKGGKAGGGAADDCLETCDGCCDDEGVCQKGTSNTSCGKDGIACEKCAEGKKCQDKKCVAESGACGSDCKGCCKDDVCVTKLSDSACGPAGLECEDCSENGDVCDRIAGQCRDKCSCENHCEGEKNDCGDTCTENTCQGCCEDGVCVYGRSDESACGKNGADCKQCKDGVPCTNGSCQATCVGDCAGRCGGVDDGCGEPCPEKCAEGCCSQWGWCVNRDDDRACGWSGVCDDCSQHSPVETCINRECTKAGGTVAPDGLCSTSADCDQSKCDQGSECVNWNKEGKRCHCKCSWGDQCTSGCCWAINDGEYYVCGNDSLCKNIDDTCTYNYECDNDQCGYLGKAHCVNFGSGAQCRCDCTSSSQCTGGCCTQTDGNYSVCGCL